MKKIIALILTILFVTDLAFAEPHYTRQKNKATKICGMVLNSTTAISIGAAVTGMDCEEDLYDDTTNGDGFADLAGAETAVGTTGEFCLDLTAGETNSEYVVLRCQATNSNAAVWIADIDTTHGTILTNASGQLDTDTIPESAFPARNTAQSAAAGTLVLAASEAFSDTELAKNTAVHIVSASTGGGQTRCICSYVGSTDTATLCENWTTTPTGTIKYDLIPTPHCDALQPATGGRTLLVNATGGTAVDWGNVQAPTTSVGLSGTTIATSQQVASVSGAVGSVTGTIGGLTAAAIKDFFDTDSTTTFAGAVAGSVVKEIADNASGGGGAGDFTISSGAAQSITAGPPAKMQLAAAATYGNDVLDNNAAVLILTSSGNTAAVGQVLCISKNVASNDEVTFNRAYKSVPSGSVSYAVIPAPNCNTLVWPQSH